VDLCDLCGGRFDLCDCVCVEADLCDLCLCGDGYVVELL
jgi:hypothetical protein